MRVKTGEFWLAHNRIMKYGFVEELKAITDYVMFLQNERLEYRDEVIRLEKQRDKYEDYISELPVSAKDLGLD